MYENHTDVIYILPINDLGSIIYRYLDSIGHTHHERERDNIIYTLLTQILSSELGYNLLNIGNYNSDTTSTVISTHMKIWKDYLWKRVADSITVNQNALYYVDILVNTNSVYVKMEESV